MKIIIGGMGLSGSTLCYNIFRIISERFNSDVDVIKIHEWNVDANLGKTIFMVRDLRDTVASMMRKDPDRWLGDVEDASKYQMMWYYDSWNGKKKDVVWRYEDYKSNTYEYVNQVLTKLNIELSYDNVVSVVDEAENIKNTHIPTHQDHIKTNEEANIWHTTKLSKRHITNGGKIGGYKDYLTEKQIRFIETKYKYFFEQQSYPIDYE
jgi:hypothetical protein